LQNEGTLPGTRMRQSQPLALQLRVAEGDQVEVEGAVAPDCFTHPPVPLLDRTQLIEQFERGQLHLGQHHGVEVAGSRLVDTVRLEGC
jgi:hypothetical protein